MPIIVVTTEKSVVDLLRRVLKARTSKAATTRAEAALRDANRGVDLDALQPGDVVVVPEVEGARAETGDLLGPLDDALVGARDALGGLVGAVAQAAAEAKEERARTTELLANEELISSAGRRDPQLKERIESVRRAMHEDGQAAVRHAADLDGAVPRWAEALESLRRLAR